MKKTSRHWTFAPGPSFSPSAPRCECDGSRWARRMEAIKLAMLQGPRRCLARGQMMPGVAAAVAICASAAGVFGQLKAARDTYRHRARIDQCLKRVFA